LRRGVLKNKEKRYQKFAFSEKTDYNNIVIKKECKIDSFVDEQL